MIKLLVKKLIFILSRRQKSTIGLCRYTRFVFMCVFDRGFLCLSSTISACHYLSLHTAPENEAGIRMGGRWEAGPRKDQCNLQSAFHTISALDCLQESEREGTQRRIKVMTQLNFNKTQRLFNPTVRDDTRRLMESKCSCASRVSCLI